MASLQGWRFSSQNITLKVYKPLKTPQVYNGQQTEEVSTDMGSLHTPVRWGSFWAEHEVLIGMCPKGWRVEVRRTLNTDTWVISGPGSIYRNVKGSCSESSWSSVWRPQQRPESRERGWHGGQLALPQYISLTHTCTHIYMHMHTHGTSSSNCMGGKDGVHCSTQKVIFFWLRMLFLI